jgi:hypothetical protein
MLREGAPKRIQNINFNDNELNERMTEYERVPIQDYERTVLTSVATRLNQKRKKYGQEPKLIDEEKIFLIDAYDVEGLRTGKEADGDIIIGGLAHPTDGKIYIAMKGHDPIDFLHTATHEMTHIWGSDSLRVLFGRSIDEALVEKIAVEIASDILRSGVLFEYFEQEIDDDIMNQLIENISNTSYVEERGVFNKMIEEEVQHGYYKSYASAIEHYEESYFKGLNR